ncbi:hypothetical protein OROHE_004982 [Orobanche hederae]
MSKKRVVIVGGTGYLGQHLLRSFADNLESRFPLALAFTHRSTPPPQVLLNAIHEALPFYVDLSTGDGLSAISNAFGQSGWRGSNSQHMYHLSFKLVVICGELFSPPKKAPDVVINCAALSVPRVCEMDQEAAMSINVPTALVKWLSSFGEGTLLIHLSTDQVYDGTKSFYKEEDETVPVNVYGKSKVEAERYISANCRSFAILRSSVIYGPQTISPVPKSLPIQWMDSQLSKGEALGFFHDEFRCPVFVKDLVGVIQILTTQWISEVDRGVKSPSDISMDISKLIQTTGISPTRYTEGVRLTLEAEDRP